MRKRRTFSREFKREAASGNNTIGMSAFEDKSVWHFWANRNPTYCWVDDENEPHCKEVETKRRSGQNLALLS